MNTKNRLFLAGCLAMATMACGQGFQGGSGSSSSGSSSNAAQGTGGTAPSPVALQQAVNGYVSGGNYDSLQTFHLDTTNGNLLVNLPLGIDPSIMISSGTISQLPGVTFSTTTSATGTAYITLSIPLKYILHGVTTLPATTLPNGDPLPNMPSTSYPAIAFDLNPNSTQQVYVYIGVDAIGVFVQSKMLSCGNLPICLNLTFPIENQAKTKVLGYLSLIMPKSGAQGGFFISTIIPNDVAVLLEGLVN